MMVAGRVRQQQQLPALTRLLTTMFLVLSYLSSPCLSTPTAAFPINSQLPPVARINQPFAFEFSPQTVKSQGPINYTLTQAPPWLSITSSKRLLSGTPTEKDVAAGLVVGIPIGIRAADSNGTAQINATLVVARTPAPAINIPLPNQIADLGPFSSPNTLLMYEQNNFTFTFDSETFRSTGRWGLTYYATNHDHTPLPSWISFDPETLTFSGKTPTFDLPSQPPQTFNLQLIASDVVGFSALSMPFSITVGNHRLTSTQAVIQLNATAGNPFVYDDFLGQVRLDDRALGPEEVVSVTPLGLPRWLAFDNKTWNFSGTPESNATATNFTVAVVDTYSDMLNVTFQVKIGSSMFNNEQFPALNLTAGEAFDFQLREYLVDPADTELSVQSDSDVSWIKVDQEVLSISGIVPLSLGARAATARAPFDLAIVATSKRTQTSQAQDLSVSIAGAATAAEPSTTATETPPSSPSSSSAAWSPAEAPKTYLWLLLPILLIIFVGAIILYFYFRRRHLRRHRRILKAEVSAPLPGTWAHLAAGSPGNDNAGDESGSETRKILGSHKKEMSTSPPEMRLAWAERPLPSQPQESHQQQQQQYSPTGPPPMSAMRGLHAAPRPPGYRRPVQALPSVGSDGQPRSGSESALDGSEDIWRASPASQRDNNHSYTRRGDGLRPAHYEVSLLSDTTIGEADLQTLKDRSATSGGLAVLPAGSPEATDSRRAATKLLEVPPAHHQHPHYNQSGQSEPRPSSIQPTPKMAYEPPTPAARKYDFDSSDEDQGCAHPNVPYGRRDPPGSMHSGGGQGRGGSIRSALGQRLSNAWRRPGSTSYARQHEKTGSDAASSVQTHTSILTTAMAEQTATTATNMASPVVVNIPSRSPNPRTQHTQRADEVAPLFSGENREPLYRMKSRQSPKESPPIQPISEPPSAEQYGAVQTREHANLMGPPTGVFAHHDPSRPRPSDSSWDRAARDAVGMAHKDIVVNHSRDEPKNAMGIVVPSLRSRQSSGRPKSPPPRPASLLSVSDVSTGPPGSFAIGMAVSSGSGWTPPPQKPLPSIPGIELAGAGASAPRQMKSRSTGSIAARSNRSTVMAETSGAESLTTAKATRPLIRSMDGPMDAQRMQFRGNLQQTTTKSNILDPGAIPEGLVYHGSDLYESPIRYHSNRYASELNKNQAMASKPSQKTVDSEGQWEDVDEDEEEDEDDDAWEDIRPPDSTRRGAWDTDGNGSNGSFPVYI
ncbi:axial budding pattern protein 2 [Microdochium nivale]|nr:axial budding pattern protein 2 [Microdochium nivale]